VGSLSGRVKRLEAQERGRPPSRTQEEVWAIDAKIMKLEREMRAEGTDPYREPDGTWTNSAGHPTHTLGEHIAMLEAELGEEIERCPEG
jgi:hypothetical protein